MFAKTMSRQKPVGFIPADVNLAPELGLALAFSGAQALAAAASRGDTMTSITGARAAFAFDFGLTMTLIGSHLGRQFGTKTIVQMGGAEKAAFGLALGISAVCIYVGVVYINL